MTEQTSSKREQCGFCHKGVRFVQSTLQTADIPTCCPYCNGTGYVPVQEEVSE